MVQRHITINLGNGTDSVIFEYGDTTWNSTWRARRLAGRGPPTTSGFGTSGTGTWPTVDRASTPVADTLITNVETLTVNGGTGDDTIDAGNIYRHDGDDLIPVGPRRTTSPPRPPRWRRT